MIHIRIGAAIAAALLTLTGSTGQATHWRTADVTRWAPLVAEIMPGEEIDHVLRIIHCESRGDPAAVNPASRTVGLLQVHPGWLRGWGRPEARLMAHDGGTVDLADPATNLQAGRWIRHLEDVAGAAPWSNWECR